MLADAILLECRGECLPMQNTAQAAAERTWSSSSSINTEASNGTPCNNIVYHNFHTQLQYRIN